jgi:uncharacterized Zn-binding protein involved in type VI secretion
MEKVNIMARGYFLTVGCKTSCGGTITTGYAHHTLSGQPTARNGDKYICGVEKQVHTILGGIPFYSIDGVAAAGTLHSREVVIVNVNLSLLIFRCLMMMSLPDLKDFNRPYQPR